EKSGSREQFHSGDALGGIAIKSDGRRALGLPIDFGNQQVGQIDLGVIETLQSPFYDISVLDDDIRGLQQPLDNGPDAIMTEFVGLAEHPSQLSNHDQGYVRRAVDRARFKKANRKSGLLRIFLNEEPN